MSLIDKLKKARELPVPAGGFTFTVRRPTAFEWHEMQGQISARELLKFVVGWDGVKECDIVNGGDPHPVPFDAALCVSWLEDKPETAGEIVSAVVQSYRDHQAKQADAAKN